ncbi:hypothetical protein FQN54_003755 [Arachnomyces sp. PD_36]|nr:hypothetical protein FQN54_003755 [Arachnomyces sp. PD_36]
MSSFNVFNTFISVRIKQTSSFDLLNKTSVVKNLSNVRIKKLEIMHQFNVEVFVRDYNEFDELIFVALLVELK